MKYTFWEVFKKTFENSGMLENFYTVIFCLSRITQKKKLKNKKITIITKKRKKMCNLYFRSIW